MLTASQAVERAARGAAFLDVQCPGWVAEIKVDTLDVRDACHCVLGQLYPEEGFGGAVETLWPGAREDEGVARQITAHGCGVGFEDWEEGGWEARGAAFALLTEAWRAEIATRTRTGA